MLFPTRRTLRKWLIEPDGHPVVAETLAVFLDELGPQAAELAALCRDVATTRLLRAGGEGFVEAIEASGLEPPVMLTSRQVSRTRP